MLDAYAWTDGSNGRTNGPGGAAAYVIANVENREIIEERAQVFQHTDAYRFTNSDMELAAVNLCLEAALRIGVDTLAIFSDSEWVVKSLLDEYVIRTEKFVSTFDNIKKMGSELEFVSIRHVRREDNPRADWLCCKATGQKRGGAHAPGLVWPDQMRLVRS